MSMDVNELVTLPIDPDSARERRLRRKARAVGLALHRSRKVWHHEGARAVYWINDPFRRIFRGGFSSLDGVEDYLDAVASYLDR
jgi:hypothetical protein